MHVGTDLRGDPPNTPVGQALTFPALSEGEEVMGPGQLRVVREAAHGGPRRSPEGVERIEVAVLGPVEVRYAARPFRRAWALDLVVYLAMHPRGVSNEQWATALWPDRVMASSTLHSTASAARRSLGRSAAGDHLPRSHGRLRLSPTVSSDWHELCRLAASPSPEDWVRSLCLVRGRPFEGLRSPDWPVLEGFLAEIEDALVHLALRVGEHHLDRREGRVAAWAARQALQASPFDERLYRLLLRVADAEGNPAGVEAVMTELAARTDDGQRLVARARGDTGRPSVTPDVCDHVHPETAALYRSLSRRRRAEMGAARGPVRSL